jgi:hypothetical protein
MDLDVRKLSDPLQKLLHLAPLEFELVVVSDMLIIAPAAMTEIFADWIGSISGGDNHRVKPATIETFPSFDYRCIDLLPIHGERDKNRLSVNASDTFSAKCNVVN